MSIEFVSDERLAEIEGQHDGCEGYLDTMELIAEVRRLQGSVVSLNQAVDSMRCERDEALARVAELEADLVCSEADADRAHLVSSDSERRAEKAEAEVERLRTQLDEALARVAELERAINAGPITGSQAIEQLRQRAEKAEAEVRFRVAELEQAVEQAVQKVGTALPLDRSARPE